MKLELLLRRFVKIEVMPPQHIDASALLRELNDHNSFFDDLVDIIPAKLYIAGNTGKNFSSVAS